MRNGWVEERKRDVGEGEDDPRKERLWEGKGIGIRGEKEREGTRILCECVLCLVV